MVNHKFQIGDKVEIVRNGASYSHSTFEKGRKTFSEGLLKYPNFFKENQRVRFTGALPVNGTTGYVVALDPTPRHSTNAVAVKYEDPETRMSHVIVMGEDGLKKLGGTVKALTTPKQLRKSNLIELIKLGQYDGLENGTEGPNKDTERAEQILEEYLSNL